MLSIVKISGFILVVMVLMFVFSTRSSSTHIELPLESTIKKIVPGSQNSLTLSNKQIAASSKSPSGEKICIGYNEATQALQMVPCVAKNNRWSINRIGDKIKIQSDELCIKADPDDPLATCTNGDEFLWNTSMQPTTDLSSSDSHMDASMISNNNNCLYIEGNKVVIGPCADNASIWHIQ